MGKKDTCFLNCSDVNRVLDVFFVNAFYWFPVYSEGIWISIDSTVVLCILINVLDFYLWPNWFLIVCISGEGEVEFEVLHVLSFDSTRKRMSVIVKHPLTKEIILYTKGADSAVLSILAKKYSRKFIFFSLRTYSHIV